MSRPHLLGNRRFLPLFLTQFLGAFNDNVFKNALVIVITFQVAACDESPLLVTVAAGLFILPFFLFSATAGQLADRFDKAVLIRYVKLAEIVIMVLGAGAIAIADLYALLAVLFLMGAQSTVFGPLKYSILPQHLESEKLMSANALIQSSTFIAILVGTIAGGTLAALPQAGSSATAMTVVGLAVLGWLASQAIPSAPSSAPGLPISGNVVRETWRLMRMAGEQRELVVIIIGISWFWFVGTTFLQLLPGYACDVFGGGPSVVTLMLTAFSIGIGVGALTCSRLAHGRIDLAFVPIGAFGIFLCTLVLLGVPPPAPAGPDLDMAQVLWRAGNLPALLAFAVLAFFGGMYVVPLFSYLQAHSPPECRARMIAALNVVNSFFMVLAALVTIALLAAGFTLGQLFVTVGTLTAAVGAWMLLASLPMREALVRRLGALHREPSA